MANESLIQVPPNVAEPIVLQRFLLRLVEELDIIMGRRGAVSEQYVAQKELIAAGDALAAAIEAAQNNLADATALLEQTIEDASTDLQDEVDALTLSQEVQDVRLAAFDNFAWFRALAVSFAGRGTNGVVTLNLDYNIASGNRTAVGVYEFTLTTTAVDGNDLLDYTQPSISYTIADSAASSAYYVQFEVISASTFKVSTFAIVQGAGTKLAYTAQDPTSSDNVVIMGMYTPPGATL